jgi:ABC-2 type transport system ATP-binding protein
MPAVLVENLSKTYRVADKKPGLLGTVAHFLHRRYRSIEAVREISFTIEPGEVVGFLGPNGAGKTTALKMLTGLIHPTAGRVEVLGHRPFGRAAELLRQITLVMGQKQQLLWDLPAMDSLRINAAVYDVPRDEATRRIRGLSELLELGRELTQPVRKLSLGQRMKCELLAALLHHPRILFLDEPTLGLDVNAQVAVRQFLAEYNRQHGATTLLTSHYMADITALCPRVILIHEGRIIHDGSLRAVVERLAPFREVKLELDEPVEAERLARYGEVEWAEGRAARMLVARAELTRAVDRMLEELAVQDLTVTDPPIEEVIGRLFRGESQAGADAIANGGRSA